MNKLDKLSELGQGAWKGRLVSAFKDELAEAWPDIERALRAAELQAGYGPALRDELREALAPLLEDDDPN